MPSRFPEVDPTLLILLSGPAGCGKTTLSDRLVASHSELRRAVTCTTRAPRTGERDGEDYYFLGEGEFDRAVGENAFLEHARVHSARYGTLRKEVEEKLASGTSIVLNIDVQGAASIREAARKDPSLRGRLVSIFVLPPGLETLRERMVLRGGDSPDSIEERLQTALTEMKQWTHYDYCIRSGSKDEDFRQLQSIWIAERRRVSRLLGGREETVHP